MTETFYELLRKWGGKNVCEYILANEFFEIAQC